MIRPSPLKLKQYFVEELQFRVHEMPPGTPPPTVELMPVDLEIRIDGFENPTNPYDMMCRVSVGLRKSDKPVPYHFFLRLAGFFEITPEGLSPSQLEAHKRFSMASVLWSTAREILADTMRKGPYPPMVLPIVTFLPEQEPADTLKGVGTASGAHQVP